MYLKKHKTLDLIHTSRKIQNNTMAESKLQCSGPISSCNHSRSSGEMFWTDVSDHPVLPLQKTPHFNTAVVTLEPNADISVPTHTPSDTS